MKTQMVGSMGLAKSAEARRSLARDLALLGGAASSLVYVGSTLVAPLLWEHYDSTAQAVSELSAIGAPSRPLMVGLLMLYNFLVIAFAWGMWPSAQSAAQGSSARKVLAWLFLVYGLSGLLAPLTPMNLPGQNGSLTDSLHIAMTILDVLLIFVMLGVGLFALGKSFRRFTVAALLVEVGFGILSGIMTPQAAANVTAGVPTPWFGVVERALIFNFLLWVAVFSVALWRARK